MLDTVRRTYLLHVPIMKLEWAVCTPHSTQYSSSERPSACMAHFIICCNICERIQLPQKWKKLNSKFHLTNIECSDFPFVLLVPYQHLNSVSQLLLLSWPTRYTHTHPLTSATNLICHHISLLRTLLQFQCAPLITFCEWVFFFSIQFPALFLVFISISKCLGVAIHCIYSFLLGRIHLNSTLFF